jgi:protein ImuB
VVRTLILWCPDWPVTAGGFDPDDLVAVVHAGRVLAASAAARASGVRLGLRKREAESRCTGLVVVGQDLPGEARMFEPVVAALTGLTPRVEVSRPGLVALEARGPGRYFGGEEALSRRVAEVAEAALDGQGVRAPRPGVGVADGRTAAMLAARHGVVVPPGGNRGFLAPFPVAVLGQPDLAELLERLGIHTLGDFADLPPSSVLARFGTEAARLQAVAQGRHQELLRAVAPDEELVSHADFDPPVERVDQAAFAGRAAATDLVDQLDRRGLVCARLRIEIETEHAESLVRLWRGDEGLGAEAMVERLRWQLHGWLSGTASETAPTAGVVVVRLAADEVAPVGGRQAGFWGGASHADRRAARGLDRLRGMLGPGAVFTAALSGGRGPGDRAVLVPWGEPHPATPDGLPWPGHHPLPPPALVHPVPLAAEVVDADGRPVTVSARGQPSAEPSRLSITGAPWSEVVGWAGPWTLDERWWDRRLRRRRARFQLADGDGAHLCVVEDARWWVEATYD